MMQGDRQLKRIFFPAGMQGRGWWKLMLVAFKLADRPVKNSTPIAEYDRVNLVNPRRKLVS